MAYLRREHSERLELDRGPTSESREEQPLTEEHRGDSGGKGRSEVSADKMFEINAD